MRIHLVDGTYELYRAHFGAPPAQANGLEVGATRGILRSILALLSEPGVTHVAAAFDTVIESFRNTLFDGYKTGEGVPPELMAQFPLAERALYALGVTVWGMTEFEADDALGTAAARWRDTPGVEQVVICSPDKDFAQCVIGDRVICLDRMRSKQMNEAGVIEKFGVSPASIPDWLALVGDSADGIPGVPRWGARTASLMLARYPHIEDIPDNEAHWEPKVRGAAGLAQNLREHRDAAFLYRTLATLRTDAPLHESLDELAWRGARRAELEQLCAEIDDRSFINRIPVWR